MPALTRFDSVCIIADDDQFFASPVWIDQLIPGKGYAYETLTIESLGGEQIATGQKHQLELKFLDPSGIVTLRSWMASGKRVWVYAYGSGGSLFWLNSSLFKVSELPESGDGKPMVYTLSMSESGWLNIRSGINLLFPTLARGEDASWFGPVINGTLTSAAKNVGFTTGSDPVLKVVQAAPGQTYVHTGAAGRFKFPVRSGMTFSLHVDTYLYNTSAGQNRKIGMKCFDGTQTQTELLLITDATIGAAKKVTGVLTIANASSKFACFQLEVNNTGGSASCEFDNAVLSVSDQTITAFTEG